MAADAILKNRHISAQFDRYRPNFVRLRSLALLSRPTVKKFKF